MKNKGNLIALTLVAFSASTLAGCKWGKKKDNDTQQKAYFAFSVGLKSGASIIEKGSGKTESLVVYDNGVDTSGRSYKYESTKPSVATINDKGVITPVAPGTVNFTVKETKSGMTKSLKRAITVINKTDAAAGGYNFSGGVSTAELNTRAEILGKLEKYAMDTHLTGITLFDNGGLVKYHERVKSPTDFKYVEGYGFGILAEGSLDPSKPLTGQDGGEERPTFYHSAISQDPKKINQYSATGSQVSDLASHITSSYWNTRLKNKTEYEWYPSLAVNKLKKPIVDANGVVTGHEANETAQSEPIPMEPSNTSGLYRKWRIYVKTGSQYKYTTSSHADSSLRAAFNNVREVRIEDYEYIYQLLFTGANGIIRGTEMANDTSYGIKGAQRFFNDTKGNLSPAQLQAKWEEYQNKGTLGLKTGTDSDIGLDYIDIELINPIDSFTAMYTLSSSLVSPLPKELFTGGYIAGSVKDSIKYFGTFNDTDSILDTTVCFGPYTLEDWIGDEKIVFTLNSNYVNAVEPEATRPMPRYRIPGVYYRVYDNSTDSEKNWKQFEKGNLDSAGVPTSKVKTQKGQANVYETKGDSTFKLNVNSCDEKEWNRLFGPQGVIKPNTQKWDLKPWMANQDFLDGIFYSLDRGSFADKRGVVASTNYFSDSYQMRNATSGSAYNATQAHKDAVAGFSENNGYNLNKAVDCFRAAVKQLSSQPNGITLGPSKDNPTNISIHIKWMYRTDVNEYGNEIKSYIETAFNDISVCGGRVKLTVTQDAVEQWEQVYNDFMMKGRFDLAFGAISGNTYNPLNFMEVLKSDNSSEFTLNWGNNTGVVDEKNPIIYKGQKWSFDALWEVADHGGIVEKGEKIKPVKSCTAKAPTVIGGTEKQVNMYEGFDLVLPVEFAEYTGSTGHVEFDASRLDIYVHGAGNVTVAEGANIEYDRANKRIIAHVTPEKADEVNKRIKSTYGSEDAIYSGDDAWKNTPFVLTQINNLWEYELYYKMTIGIGGQSSINYTPVSTSDN